MTAAATSRRCPRAGVGARVVVDDVARLFVALAAAAALALALASSAEAAVWQKGDLLITVQNQATSSTEPINPVLLVVDPSDLSLRSSIALSSAACGGAGFSGGVGDVAVDPKTGTAYVACTARSAVAVVDGATGGVLRTFPTAPCTSPVGLAIIGGSIFTGTQGSGICKYNMADGALQAQYATANAPQYITPLNANTMLYQAAVRPVQLGALDLTTGVASTLATLRSSGFPAFKTAAGLATLPNGNVAVTGDAYVGMVSSAWVVPIFNVTLNTRPQDVAASPDGTKLYIVEAYFGSNDRMIRVYNSTTLTQITEKPHPGGFSRYSARGVTLYNPTSDCTEGLCCNTTSETFLTAGTVCNETANPCLAQLCTGKSAECPATLSTLPDGTECAFDAPTRSNKARLPRGYTGTIQACPKADEQAYPDCTGQCLSASCGLTFPPAGSCCVLPESDLPPQAAANANPNGNDNGNVPPRCYCWKKNAATTQRRPKLFS